MQILSCTIHIELIVITQENKLTRHEMQDLAINMYDFFLQDALEKITQGYLQVYIIISTVQLCNFEVLEAT